MVNIRKFFVLIIGTCYLHPSYHHVTATGEEEKDFANGIVIRSKKANKPDDDCEGDFCSSSTTKRYILYDVNRGEGFNLRRDIFVRIAPIVKSLNTETASQGDQWILVLPPWGNLPHWKTSQYFSWATFFDLQEIQKYIPAIEFETYLDEFGLDNPIDAFYKLQHFPLNSPISKKWFENVRADVKCESPISFARDTKSGLYSGRFWNTNLYAKSASCLGIKGQSSNLVHFLMDLSPNSVLFDRGEVILWDHYGGKNWWAARKSLKFAPDLIQTAKEWTEATFPLFNQSDILHTSNYLAIHLRRGDFVKYRKNQPSLKDVAHQIKKVVAEMKISHIFFATDGNEQDIKEIQNHVDDHNLTFLRFPCPLSEGECAIIEQVICSWSKYFVGTAESTFTYRIFEEREILGVLPEFNYHILCVDSHKSQCSKSTRWPIL